MAKEKKFRLHFVTIGNQSDEIIQKIVKKEIEMVLAKYGVVSYNLNEVLSKYISEEMRNEHKKDQEKQGLHSG